MARVGVEGEGGGGGGGGGGGRGGGGGVRESRRFPEMPTLPSLVSSPSPHYCIIVHYIAVSGVIKVAPHCGTSHTYIPYVSNAHSPLLGPPLNRSYLSKILYGAGRCGTW